MNILHVTNHFAPCIGGIERHVQELCDQLTRRGHTADVLCLNRCSSGPVLPPRDRHRRTTIYRLPFLDLKYYKMGSGVLRYLQPYDVVHVHGLGYFFDLLAATQHLHRKKIILSTHGGFFHTPRLTPLKRLHFSLLTRAAIRQAHKVVAVSKADYDLFSSITGNLDYIPNGIDCTSFRPLKKVRNSFLFLGRAAANKRIDRLIRTFALLSGEGARLTIAGDSTASLRPSAGDGVTVVGEVSERRKRQLLGRTMFFVSAAEYEGFGISLLEAMASGCIPLVSPIRPFADILNGAGAMIDYRKPDQAADAIRGVMDGDLRGMRKSVIKKAGAYDWRKIIGQWERVYG